MAERGNPRIVVGVVAASDVSGSRFRDFTPTSDSSVPRVTGGAAVFSRFVSEELVPFVDARYATAPDERALMGHSLGGLFAVYQFLVQTRDAQTFTHIAAASPSLWWDGGSVFDLEQEVAAANTRTPAELFLSTSTLESADIVLHTQELGARLDEGAHYEGLRWTHRSYPATGHGWSWEKAYPDALEFFDGAE